MIYKVTGKLIAKHGGKIAVETGGLAYEILLSMNSYAELPPLDTEVSLFTHFVMKEDGVSLYGFSTLAEKEQFLLLNTVSKVGPKLALAILGNITGEELARAVSSQDVTRLSKVPGIGKKSAERIIVELKDKLIPAGGSALPQKSFSVHEDVISALINLGYKEADSRVVTAKLEESDFQSMLRKALAQLAG